MKLCIQKLMTGLAMTFVVASSVFAPFMVQTHNTISPAIAYAQTEVDNALAQTTVNASQFSCSIDKDFDLQNCIVAMTIEVLRWFHIVVGWTGTFADIALDMSISSDTYSKNAEFVTKGWEIVRDITNIFFILILLLIAIGTILRIDRISAKKLLPTLIILALVINFSLFITKVIIDGGNILSRAFIGNMTIVVQKPDPENPGNFIPDEKDYVQFSQIVAQAMAPQKMLAMAGNQVLVGNNAMLIPYFFLIIITYGFIIYVFVMVGFLFIARFIGLWFLMILAPIAFISHASPFGLPNQMDHRRWWKELASLAFQPAIFLFFMYILLHFLDTGGFVSSIYSSTQNGNFLMGLIGIVLPIIIICAFVYMALQAAKKMGGELANVATKAGGAVLGLGAAAVTGGTAWAMRGAVGGAVGSRMAQSEMSGKFGNMVRATGNKLQTSSFDARQTKFSKNLMAKAQMDTLGLNTMGERQGGFKGAKERKVRADQERAKLLNVNEFTKMDSESKLNTKIENKEKELTNEKNSENKAKIKDELHELETKKNLVKARNSGNSAQERTHEKELTKIRHNKYAAELEKSTSLNGISNLTDAIQGTTSMKQVAANRIKSGNNIELDVKGEDDNATVKLLKELVQQGRGDKKGGDAGEDGDGRPDGSLTGTKPEEGGRDSGESSGEGDGREGNPKLDDVEYKPGDEKDEEKDEESRPEAKQE